MNILPYKQSDASRCGPAVIKMVLSYYGIDATEDEICKRCGHTYELGCDDKGMKAAVESYGLAAEIYNECTLEDLEYWTKHHIPVIVDFFTSQVYTTPNGHSGIVVEVDRETVYLLDPEIAQVRNIPRNDFLRAWFDWRSPYISSWDDMVIRQMIVVYPNRLKNV